MAKRKKSESKRNVRAQRDFSESQPKKGLRPSFLLIKPKKYQEVQDGRISRPDRMVRPEGSRLIDGRPADITLSKVSATGKRLGLQYAKVRYVNPRRVVTCKRRADRRKALFRTRKIGKGKATRRFKNRVMTDKSKVRC